MVRKKIDNRIRVLIENGVALKHRSLFVLVGDHSRDQVGQDSLWIFIFQLLFFQLNIASNLVTEKPVLPFVLIDVTKMLCFMKKTTAYNHRI